MRATRAKDKIETKVESTEKKSVVTQTSGDAAVIAALQASRRPDQQADLAQRRSRHDAQRAGDQAIMAGRF
jgi:hypothetical protein